MRSRRPCQECNYSQIAGPHPELRCCHPMVVDDWVKLHGCNSTYGYPCRLEDGSDEFLIDIGSGLCLNNELFMAKLKSPGATQRV